MGVARVYIYIFLSFLQGQGGQCFKQSQDQQRGFPLQKYFVPGCVGRGLDLDLRARPTPAPAASGNLEIWEVCPLGIGLEKPGVRDITGQKFQGRGLKLKAFILTGRDLDRHLCQKNK